MYISCTYNALALLAWKNLHHTGEVCGFGKKTKMCADLVIKICNCAEMVKNRSLIRRSLAYARLVRGRNSAIVSLDSTNNDDGSLVSWQHIFSTFLTLCSSPQHSQGTLSAFSIPSWRLANLSLTRQYALENYAHLRRSFNLRHFSPHYTHT